MMRISTLGHAGLMVMLLALPLTASARPTLYDRGDEHDPDLTKVVQEANEADARREAKEPKGTGDCRTDDDCQHRDDPAKSFDEQDHPKDYE